jgi:hypothetical protein
MFTLSPAGRHNLEAILFEFERAARRFGGLYHERFENEDDFGNALATSQEWFAFIAYSALPIRTDEESQWHYFRMPGWPTSIVGRYFGDLTGSPIFALLVEDLLTILNREDLSAIPDKVIPFDFSSVVGWIGTLHSWAFRIQMPLLSSEMKIWGMDDIDPEVGFSLATEWVDCGGGLRYPKHPYRFTLDYDLFTSSMTAIRALLEPEFVIGQNEPWPLKISYRQLHQTRDDFDREVSEPKASVRELASDKHVINHGLFGWEVWFKGADKQFRPVNQAGLHRLAVLIETAPEQWCPRKLLEYGARKSGRLGRAGFNLLTEEQASELDIVRPRKNGREEVPSEVNDERKNIFQRLSELRVERETAQKDGDQLVLQEIGEEIGRLAELLNDKDRDWDFKKAKDGIRATISRTIKELSEKFPERQQELILLEKRVDTKSTLVSFHADPKDKDWIVNRDV